ncbi:MAG: glycerol-3-phosphate 1-O-acyltransferase PlsY [Syntrophomonadaceae bacterium]|nr:glycerol-3-phosphate 1-O-acyltransferase PlsY [Syntrophomonadaceae bacterium]MDD3024331.1 glycerol-3-phosphate 1-O-acyltransferase PlsY [Syntrophomonadaceae bacterium]
MKEAAIIGLCYFIGSIPFSYLFTRLFTKQDIRKKGSGNVGATNALRTSGIRVGMIALAGDLFKGVAAAYLGRYIGGDIVGALCAFMAVFGHCYPVFLGFRGGKGVATAAGAILVLMPMAFLILLISLVGIAYITRFVSLGSVVAAFMFPLLTIVWGKPWTYIIISIFIAALVIYRHRGNIERLRNGSEPKINDPV